MIHFISFGDIYDKKTEDLEKTEKKRRHTQNDGNLRHMTEKWHVCIYREMSIQSIFQIHVKSRPYHLFKSFEWLFRIIRCLAIKKTGFIDHLCLQVPFFNDCLIQSHKNLVIFHIFFSFSSMIMRLYVQK